MAHPLATKAISSARVKNDSVDARTLAHLLRTNLLPEAWIAPPDAREARRLARMRTWLVRICSQLRCHIHAVLADHGVHSELSNVFGGAGRIFLEGLRLPPVSNARLKANLRLIDALTEEVAEAERQLRRLFRGAERDERVGRLVAIPGIGFISAVVVVTEVWDITRLASPDRLCSRARLTPSERSSADHTRRGTSPSKDCRGSAGSCSRPPPVLRRTRGSIRRPHRFAARRQGRHGRARPPIAHAMLLSPPRRGWLPSLPARRVKTLIVVGALVSRHGLNRRPPI
jgi:hypothetical protein